MANPHLTGHSLRLPLLLEVTMCLNSLALSREAKDLSLFYDPSYPFEASENKRVIATSAWSLLFPLGDHAGPET